MCHAHQARGRAAGTDDEGCQMNQDASHRRARLWHLAVVRGEDGRR